MTLLPIVERELRVAARRRGTYRMRLSAALVAIALFGWTLLAMLRTVPSAMHGRYLFRALFGFAFVYCLFIGARLTADCLSGEKRDGTLGLLFLTDLKGYDVVLGKLAATSVNSVYALLAIVPVISLPVQLGGVTAAELWQSALVLLNTLFFSMAAGVFVSTLSRNERKSMFAAVFVVLFLTFAPLATSFALAMSLPQTFGGLTAIWPLLALSPAYAPSYLVAAVALPVPATPLFSPSGGLYGYVTAPTTTLLSFFPVPKGSFWWSALLVHLMSWLMLSLSSLILPRIWQGGAANTKLDRQRERVEQWAYGGAEARRALRARLLDINPFLWLAGRERWKPFYVWLYLGAVAATWLWGWFNYDHIMFDQDVTFTMALLFQTFLKLWIVSEACTRLAEDRRIGALELLLSTPLTTREMLRGQWLALRRQFAKPLAVILVAEFLLLCQQFATQLVLINLLMLLADVLTLGWVGMWLGLTSRNLNRAIVGTIGRVLILPWGAFSAAMLALEGLGRLSGGSLFQAGEHFSLYCWFGVGLANNCLFGVWWARRHLLNDFRKAATQRYQSEKIGWFSDASRCKDVAQMRASVAAS